jgi:hypothetical protein
VKLQWLNCGKVWVKLRWLKPIRHKNGLLGGCDSHTDGETSVCTFKLVETIENPCSDLLVSHQRECEYAWRKNGDVSHLEIRDEITTHGECVQPLQSVKLL